MIAYFVTHDLKFVHARVVKKPYSQFIDDIYENSFLAISMIALSKGGKVTLNSLQAKPLYRFNNWFDYSDVTSRAEIKNFVYENGGNFFDFELQDEERYYKIKNGGFCPLCGESHTVNNLSIPQKLCEKEILSNPQLFGMKLNLEMVVLC